MFINVINTHSSSLNSLLIIHTFIKLSDSHKINKFFRLMRANLKVLERIAQHLVQNLFKVKTKYCNKCSSIQHINFNIFSLFIKTGYNFPVAHFTYFYYGLGYSWRYLSYTPTFNIENKIKKKCSNYSITVLISMNNHTIRWLLSHLLSFVNGTSRCWP